VESAASYIIVFDKGKYLGFIGISIVIGAVHNLVNVANVGWAPYGFSIGAVVAANGFTTLGGEVGTTVMLTVVFYALGELGSEMLVYTAHLFSSFSKF
jgi:hypothetical protein